MTDIGNIIGGIGGSLGIITSLANFIRWWRGRGKLDFKVLRPKYLVILYSEWEIEQARKWPYKPYPDWEPLVAPGDIHRAFSILEFSIKNNYPNDVIVGRMDIDGWIFSDHWSRPMGGQPQDYRVYDLQTRERVDLSQYVKLAPKTSVGRRVEILEEAEGPGYVSPKRRARLEKRAQFNATIHSDTGTLVRGIPVKMEEVYSFDMITHWGDLLPPAMPGSAGAPPP